MRLTRTSDLWWKNAVVYCLDVETYQDGNGDGIGDFAGLTQRIDHLERLGVTCVWLMPFYPTRERDDGYDITDFYGVDPRLGTLGDFTEFVRTAKDRGIRVIADLVVNHTSEDHPWFQDARSGRDSAHRDWYVWADEPPKDGPQGVVFPDAEDSLWEYDQGSAQYYLHRFYKQQPDLNVANPEVRDEIARVMGFWTELGLSGFRVDAVPFLLETAGQADAGALPDPHEYLADLRAFLGRRNGEAVLLGEVNLPYDDTARFFGDPASDRGDELTMCFDFIAMQQMYLSMAREDAGPLAGALRDRPAAPRDAHWATFVRNHDELTLDKLSKTERAEVFASFGPDKNMQLYDRGLRRRLPPMVEGDRRRVELAYSLLFTLPGTPVLFYGEELGMGRTWPPRDARPYGRPCSGPRRRAPASPPPVRTPFPTRWRRARSDPRRSTCTSRVATRARCSAACGCSLSATGRLPSWPGATTASWTPRSARSWRTSPAPPTEPTGLSWRCTTSRAGRSPYGYGYPRPAPAGGSWTCSTKGTPVSRWTTTACSASNCPPTATGGCASAPRPTTP